MLVVMAISFFTVRVVLEKLGISDYGIYNIVGSIVVVFSFLKTTLTSASQRFFSYTIGKGNVVDLIEMFKTNLLFYLIICILIIFFAETVGLWFLNNKLNIPSDRLYAANWVFQMSILGFVFTTLTVPYESVITSHENMGIYAYISILEALLKLMIAYGVIWFSFDKLIVYSILVAISSFIVFLSYLLYCRRKYEECRFGFLWNKDMFKEVVSILNKYRPDGNNGKGKYYQFERLGNNNASTIDFHKYKRLHDIIRHKEDYRMQQLLQNRYSNAYKTRLDNRYLENQNRYNNAVNAWIAYKKANGL